MDLPDSSVHRIFQASTLEWQKSESCSVLSDCLWPHGLYSPWNSPGQNTGVGSLSLLPNPGIEPRSPALQVGATREAQEYWSGEPIPSPADLPDPGIEPGSPALQVDSLPTELSGKPILEWLAISFSWGSSQLRDQTGSPALQTNFLLAELRGKPLGLCSYILLLFCFVFFSSWSVRCWDKKYWSLYVHLYFPSHILQLCSLVHTHSRCHIFLWIDAFITIFSFIFLVIFFILNLLYLY